MIDLASFNSYRNYLRELYLDQKSRDSRTTLATFAKPLGMTASGFKMILDGSRNLTVHKIHEVARGLRLQQRDREYFEALVLRDQAESRSEKEYYGARVKRSLERQEMRTVRVSRKEFLSEWYTPALLLHLVDQTEIDEAGKPRLDYERIREKIGLDRAQADRIIAFFRESGILAINRSDRAYIEFEKIGALAPKRQFLLKLLEQSKRRIETSFDAPENYFEAHTWSMPAENFECFVADYKALVSKHMAPRESGEEKIFQAQISLFPVI